MPLPARSIPLKSEWPSYISTSVVINAPRKQVWDTLVDFSSYSAWNPYIRQSTHLEAAVGQKIAAGHRVALKVHIPPTMDSSAKLRAMTETVKHVEPQHQLAWGSHLPGWLFGAEHWNVLTDVPGGTKFEIIAVFSGAGPYVMMLSMRAPFTASLEAMAEGLKTRCEKN